MNDLKNILRDVGYFGVGAAAVLVEAGGKVVKSLVRKGEKVLHDNQDTVDEIKEKAKEAGARIKAAVKDLTDKPEPTVEAAPAEDIPMEEEPAEASPAEESPVVPDAIYHTDEPAPAAEAPAEPTEADEHPEETING